MKKVEKGKNIVPGIRRKETTNVGKILKIGTSPKSANILRGKNNKRNC